MKRENHDEYFKNIMTKEPSIVQDLLEVELLKKILDIVDLDTLTSFNPPWLQSITDVDITSDAVYTVQPQGSKQPGQELYLHLIHQRMVDETVFVMAVKFAVDLQRAITKPDEDIPPVLPLIVYAGRESYDGKVDLLGCIPKRFQECFRGKISWPIQIVDLTKVLDEDFICYKRMSIPLYTLKNFDRLSWQELIQGIENLFVKLSKELHVDTELLSKQTRDAIKFILKSFKKQPPVAELNAGLEKLVPLLTEDLRQEMLAARGK